jgi:hypothetical protein
VIGSRVLSLNDSATQCPSTAFEDAKMNSCQHSKKNARRGATAVEFAFCAPILLTVVFGVIEFGRAVMIQNALTNAAKEGCRKATLATTRDTNQVTAVVNRQMNIAAPQKQWDVTCNPSNLTSIASGSEISVDVALNYADISWVPRSLLPSNLRLRGQAVHIRE